MNGRLVASNPRFSQFFAEAKIISRSTPVARSLNGRAGANGPVASESETLVLRATPSIKRYNIAQFDLPELPHFSSCA
ncbi:hypothetical protein PsorP6_006636 [Peronosclerospora sorghi]|uniref:Uncharacterized protein n=1 Tax=Peronosclerospora sorghi TaxID=230839 RepID=A0ACC0W2K7_9STRA|nr:hypothetical protein PsorP6_006636 [Peronosclerospora sorghi]